MNITVFGPNPSNPNAPTNDKRPEESSLINRAYNKAAGKIGAGELITVPTDNLIDYAKAIYGCAPLAAPELQNPRAALEFFYKRIFNLANKENLQSIHIPTFSTSGPNCFDQTAAASIAIFEALQFLTNNPQSNLTIHFVVYSGNGTVDQPNLSAYQDQLALLIDRSDPKQCAQIKLVQGEIQKLKGEAIFIPVRNDFHQGVVAKAIEQQVQTNKKAPVHPSKSLPPPKKTIAPPSSTISYAANSPSTQFFKQLSDQLTLDIANGSIKIPALDWTQFNDKLFADPHFESNFSCFHETIKNKVVAMLDSITVKTTKKGFYKGLNVSALKDVDNAKQKIKKLFDINEASITRLMKFLSEAGMAEYADQLRTSLAGKLGIKAKNLPQSVSFTHLSQQQTGLVHEDFWTEAIREGYLSFLNKYVPKLLQAQHVIALQKLESSPFTQWDHKKIYSNKELHKVLSQKMQLECAKVNTLTLQECTVLLEKLTFLCRKDGQQFLKTISNKFPLSKGEFEKVFKSAHDKSLDALGKKEQYYNNLAEAEKLAQNFKLLAGSFGEKKVHPHTLETVAQACNITQKALIAELQTLGVIGKKPDQDGYYPLGPNEYSYNQTTTEFFQTKEGRVRIILDLAKGVVNNRYAARFLAPTLYQGKTSNENFEIPRQKLPLVLQYDDVRSQIVRQTKLALMNLLDVSYNAIKGKFLASNPQKLALIQDTSVVASLPKGPSIISVFMDSLASLGEEVWAKELLEFLVQSNGGARNSFWDNAITNQTALYQKAVSLENFASLDKKTTTKRPVSAIEEAGYLTRRDSLLKLHKNGNLLVRVFGADGEELLGSQGIYSGKWPFDRGSNLSTTMIPQEKSPINMTLFSDGARAVAIDPFTVTPEYLGNSFLHNAVTQWNTFEPQLKKRPDGIPFEEVQKTLAKESATVEAGYLDAVRDHTEITWFRAAERSLVQGLFFKVNDKDFADNLRDLVKSQDSIRQKFGFFLPLFAYKDGHFQEIIVDKELLRALGLSESEIPVRTLSEKEQQRRVKQPESYFNFYGNLDTKTVIAAKEQMALLPPTIPEHVRHQTNFKKLFDLQLMFLQIKDPKGKVSFTVPVIDEFKIEDFVHQQLKDFTGNKNKLIEDLKLESASNGDNLDDKMVAKVLKSHGNTTIVALDRMNNYVSSLLLPKEQIVDLNVIDNLHLVFPTISITGNQDAEAQDLFFSHALYVRFLRDNPEYKEFWLQMVKRNMKVFLGIDLTTTKNDDITNVTFNKEFVSFFKDGQDPSGKTQYAKCVSRALQLLLLLDKSDWSKNIIIALRKTLGDDFGKQSGGLIDFFTNSIEIQAIEAYLKELKDPNKERITLLPSSAGKKAKTPNFKLQPGRFSNVVNLSKSPAPSITSRFGPAPVLPSDWTPADKDAAVKTLTNMYDKLWTNHPFTNERNAFTKKQGYIPSKLGGLVSGSEYNKAIVRSLVGDEFKNLLAEGAYDTLKEDAKSFRVFYNSPVNKNQIKDFLTKTAVHTTDGDLNLLLPNGATAITNPADYLTDDERRIKRAYTVLAGRITVSAAGGYGSQRTKLDKKINVVFLGTAGAQFEKYGMKSGELEVRDFIVKQGAKENKSLYGTIMPSNDALNKTWTAINEKILMAKARGEKTSLSDLRTQGMLILPEDDPRSLEADVICLRNGDFFLYASFKKEIDAYMSRLVLPAMNGIVGQDPRSVYLKATAFGTGFFAALGVKSQFQTCLKKYVFDSLVKTYERLIQQGKFKPGAVIDFPYYNLEAPPQSLKDAAQAAGVILIWKKNRDLLDFSVVTSVTNTLIDPAKYLLVVKAAGDVFSLLGNEPQSTGGAGSLDSMLGNNSDLRLAGNAHFNPELLNPANYIEVGN